MRFLLISYNDSDGVGQTVANLNSTLNALGHDSKIVLLDKTTNSDKVIKLKRSFLKRIFFYFLEFIKKRYSDLFSFGNSTISFNEIEKYTKNSEVLIIYTFHKILSIKMLQKLYNQKKHIYLRPLDMELATGGCHVNFIYDDGSECKKYLSGCDKCPKLNSFNLLNISKRIFNEKKEFMEKYKPTIFLENKFTKNIYEKSPITAKANSEVIYLPVRDSRKKNISKNEARKFFNFSEKEIILLFGTYNLDAPHKGGRIIGEILNLFVNFCNKNKSNLFLNNKIKLVTFGRKQGFKINNSKIDWYHLNEIKNDWELNALYRSADLFLSPSTGCNAPSTVREATVNDIPIIAFENGEASEAIINNLNGILVPNYDKKKFAEAIFESVTKKKFVNKNNWSDKLKKRYSSDLEAKFIISKVFSDLKK